MSTSSALSDQLWFLSNNCGVKTHSGRGWRKLVLIALYCNAYQYASKLAHLRQCLFLCNLGVHWFAMQNPAILNIKFDFFKMMGCCMGRLLPSIMKFKNTCISSESKTFYPYEKCRTYVNQTIFARQWCHWLRNNHRWASVFPIGTNFVQVSPHSDTTLQDLHFADDIVLLDPDSTTAIRHVAALSSSRC